MGARVFVMLWALILVLGVPLGAGAQEYRIGFVAAITGPASSLGVPERDLAQLVQKEWDAKGGITGPDGKRYPVKIIIHDDESKADTTVRSVKKLIGEDKVHVVIASSQSPTSLAVIPVATEAAVPLISMASSHAIVTPIKERFWIFKTPQSNIHVALHQVKYLKAKGFKKVASLYVNDAFGDDSRRGLAQVLQGTGIEVAYEDKFEQRDTDMTPQLTKAKASGAQALIIHAIGPSSVLITRQAKDLGLTLPIVHNHGIGTKFFIQQSGPAAEGVIFPIGKLLVAEQLPDADPQKKALLDFVRFYETPQRPRSTFAGHAWDALQIAGMALGKVAPGTPTKETYAKIRDGIEGVKNFAGTGGIFNMSAEDHVGLDERSMVLVRIEGGDWKHFPPEKW
jgi:branched-chain amino acid transport system substrate-binding protein